MRFHHEFMVPLSVDAAWRTRGDIENLGPYLPGTKLRRGPGDTFSGATSFRLGPLAVKYTGTGAFTSKNDAERVAVMRAEGVSADGGGRAGGTVTARLVAVGTKETRVVLDTDLKFGAAAASMGAARASQFGGQFLGNVSANLADQLRRRVGDSQTATDVPPVDAGEASFEVTTPPGNLAAGGVRLTKQTPSDTGDASHPSRPESRARGGHLDRRSRVRTALRSPGAVGAMGLAAGALVALATKRARNG